MTAILTHRRSLRPPAAAGGFNPLTQVACLHGVWASDPAWSNPGNGNAVPSWRNQSGGGDPAAAGSAQPIYRSSTAAFNSQPTVQFDGTDDNLFFNITDQTSPWKVILVYAFTTAAGNKTLMGNGNNTSSGIGTSSTPFVQMSNGGTDLVSSTAPDTTAHIIRATFDTGSSQLWRDEVSLVSGAVAVSALSRWIIAAGGTTSPSSRFAACHIAFNAIYTGATSDASLSTLVADLKTFYGTP